MSEDLMKRRNVLGQNGLRTLTRALGTAYSGHFKTTGAQVLKPQRAKVRMVPTLKFLIT